MAITLAQAQANLDAWVAASAAVASAQSYEIDTGNGRRRLTRADAAEIQNMIKFWEAKVSQLDAGSTSRRRVRYLVPE